MALVQYVVQLNCLGAAVTSFEETKTTDALDLEYRPCVTRGDYIRRITNKDKWYLPYHYSDGILKFGLLTNTAIWILLDIFDAKWRLVENIAITCSTCRDSESLCDSCCDKTYAMDERIGPTDNELITPFFWYIRATQSTLQYLDLQMNEKTKRQWTNPQPFNIFML